MPKRPCALVLTEDDSTIITADKFGDVYSLPLIPAEIIEISNLPNHTPEPAVKPFTPAANELTIHSLRNRKALENQRRHPNKATEKSEPSFEHKLLFGHVSLLTDIALVALGSRWYIITADRDEHIRISRGIPQAHVIEGFCLGHTEFVSRLCIPVSRHHLLISGGGDNELFLWDWEPGNLLCKADLRTHVSAVIEKFDKGGHINVQVESLKIAVSGIYWTKQAFNGSFQDFILATCEGLERLLLRAT